MESILCLATKKDRSLNSLSLMSSRFFLHLFQSPTPVVAATNGDSVFDADTDVDSDSECWPELPDFLAGVDFYLAGLSKSDARTLERKVKCGN